EAARWHAIDRLAEGFDLSAVVRELSMLRQCVLALWFELAGAPLGEAARALDGAIDEMIVASVATYTSAQTGSCTRSSTSAASRCTRGRSTTSYGSSRNCSGGTRRRPTS